MIDGDLTIAFWMSSRGYFSSIASSVIMMTISLRIGAKFG